jgi:hypothetical protein
MIRSSSIRRCRDDRGAVLAEFALFAPLLAVLAMGLLEFGLLFRQANTLRTATRAAARAGTNTFAGGGDNAEADWNVLLSIKAGVASIDSDEIVKIVVYRASSADGEVPDSCKNHDPANGLYGSPGATCNVYTGAFLATVDDSDSGYVWSGTYDDGWDPAGRDVDSDGGTDYLGVWIETEHATVTGLFGDTMSLTDATVMRLEPDFDLGG